MFKEIGGGDPPDDLTEGIHSDCQAFEEVVEGQVPENITSSFAMCGRKAGHEGDHYDDVDKVWWREI